MEPLLGAPSRCCRFNFDAFVLLTCRLKLATARHLAPSHPLQRHDTDTAANIAEPFAALGSTSRPSRRTKVSIQRPAPSLPPAISATKGSPVGGFMAQMTSCMG